ncbi:MAG: hypothetical protein ACK5V3_11355 [Bdellovibrionales bacterium]
MISFLSPILSHFKTIQRFGFVLYFLFFYSISIAQVTQKENLISRPASIEINEARHAQSWNIYFEQLKNLYPEVLSLELGWLATEFRYWSQRGSKASPFFEFLESNRKTLPLEVRWFLSAIEIQRGTIKPLTLSDARQAVERMDFTEEFNLFDIFKTPRLSRDIFYIHPDDKTQTQKVIRLYSLDALVEYFGEWHKSAALNEDNYISDVLQSKRLRWFRAAINLTRDFDVSGIRELVSLFVEPKMRTFSDPANQYEFYKSSVLLLEKVQLMYARYTYDNSQGLQYGVVDKNKIPYLELAGHIKSWLATDIFFVFNHFFKLTSLGVFSLDEFFQRQTDETAKPQLIRILEGDSEVDSKLAAGIYLIRNLNSLDGKLRDKIIDQVILIFIKAKVKPAGFEIYSGKSIVVIKPEIYYRLLSLFYAYAKERPAPSANMWVHVLTSEVIKFSTLSDSEWTRLENLRLDCLRANVEGSALENYLIQLISGKKGSDLAMRTLAGAYVRKNLNPDALQDFTSKVLSASGSDWGRNSAELVYAIHSLNPQHPGLIDYLNQIYSKQVLTSALSPQEALRLLGLSGQAVNLHLKSELLKKLNVVGVGDTAGTFLAFIRMFPNEVFDMASVIHRHRSAPEKLRQLLQILIQSSVENSVILNLFLSQLSDHPEKGVSTATYQGLTLDKWLQYQVNRVLSAKCESTVSSHKSNSQGVKK